jgi:hypothetical protein
MAFENVYDKDIEKMGSVRPGLYTNNSAVPRETFEQQNTLYAKVQGLAARFHVEQRGIERVPENERDDTSLLNVGTMVRRIERPEKNATDFIRSGSPPTW